MTPKLLKTADDHQVALKRLEELMIMDPVEDSDESRELELLAFLIESYEKQTIKISPPSAIEAIRFRMEQDDLKQQDLVPFMGSKARVSEVLSGKRPLTLSMIRLLHHELQIPADVLLQEPGEELPERIDPDSFPVREMHRRGWFPESKGLDWIKVKDRSEEMLQKFFGGRQNEKLLVRNRLQPRSKSKVDYEALHAWRCRVIDRGMKKELPDYKAADLTPEFIKGLTHLSREQDGPKLGIRAIEERGIAVVIEERLEKTHLDGAALLLPNGRPLIGLTLRHNRLDNFWFCLFHELGHVKLHLGESNQNGFCDSDIDKNSEMLIERQADAFALESFILKAEWEDLKQLKLAKEIRDAAKRLFIHESIIAGRLRREAQDYRRHRTLIGQGKPKAILEMESE